MADNDSMLKLTAALDKAKSTKQLNQDIKNIEKTINQLHLVAKLYQGESRTQLNASIKELEKKVDVIRLKAEIDNKKLKTDLDHALSNVSLKEININEQGMKVSAMKIAQSLNSVLSKYTIVPKIDLKPEGFKKDLTGIQSKINSVATAFELARTGIVKFKQSTATLKEISSILNDISKAAGMSREEIKKLGKVSFQSAGTYGASAKDYLLSVLSMAKSGYGSVSKELGELSLLAQSLGSVSAAAAESFIKSMDTAYQYSGSVEKLTRALEGVISVSMQSKIPLSELTTAMEANAASAAKAGIGIDQLTAAEATLIASSSQSGAFVGQSFQSVLDQLGRMNQSSQQLTEPIKRLEEMANAYSSISSQNDVSLFGDMDSQEMSNPIKVLLEQWSLYEQLLINYSNGSQAAMEAASATASTWESQLISLQNSWDSFIYSLTSQNQSSGVGLFLEQTLVSIEALEENIKRIPQMLESINGTTPNTDNKSFKSDSSMTPISFDLKSILKPANNLLDFSKSVDKLEESLIKGEYGLNLFSASVARNHVTLKDYLATCTKEAPASLSGYKAHLKNTGIETDLLRSKTILLNAAMSGIVAIAMQVLSMAISAIGQAIYDHYHQVEIAEKALADAEQKLEDSNSRISSINDKLKETSDRLNELNAKGKLTFIEQEEVEKLKTYNEELNQQLLAEKAINEYNKQNERKKTLDYLNAETDYTEYDGFTPSLPNRAGAPISQAKIFTRSGTVLDKTSSELAEIERLKTELEGKKAEVDRIKASDPKGYKWDIKYQNTDKERSILEGRIKELETTLAEEIPKITEKLYNLDSENDKDAISKIKYILNSYIRQSPDITPEEKFNNIWNSEEFSNSKNLLTSQVGSGNFIGIKPIFDINFQKLTSETGLGYAETYQKVISSAQQQINDEMNNNFIKSFSGLPINEIKDYINQLDTGDLNETTITSFENLNKIIQSTGVSSASAIENIKNFSKNIDFTPELEANMKKAADLVNSINQEFQNTDKISSSSLKSMADQFPAMESDIENYKNGLISSKALHDQLLEVYKNDAESFQVNMVNKLSENDSFYENVRKNNQSLFVDLAIAYGNDLKNWKNLMTAKGRMKLALEKTLSDMWTGKYGEAGSYGSYENNIKEGKDGQVTVISDDPTAIYEKGFQNIEAETDKYNGFIRQLNDAAKAEITIPDITNSNSGSKATTSPKNTSSVQKQMFDWADRYEKYQDDKRSTLKDTSSNTYIDYLGISEDDFKRGKEILDNEAPTIEQLEELKNMAEKSGLSINDLTRTLTSGTWSASRQSALQQLVQHDKTALEDQTKIIDQYQSQYDAVLSKIDPNYRSKIEKGELSTDNLSGAEAENVQAAIAAYDKLKASKDKQIDLQKNYTESFMASYENQAAAVKAENDELKASSSLIEKQIAYMKSAGELIDASIYNKLIEQSKQQEANTQRLIEIKQKEMQDLREQNLNSENSESYQKLDQEVSDLESSLLDLKKSQEEYNFQLLKMPIEHMETVAGMYKNIQSAMENWNSELEASGKKADSSYYQKLISNGFTLMDQYQKQAGLIEDVMNEYEAGTDNWNELYSKLQNVNSEMSSMVQNLHKWNEALLKMPLEKITANSSDLQKLLSGLESVKGEYDTVISAVTGAINDQVKAINKQKEAVNEEYEASKKSLQDKLDLLSKQNEKLKLQQRYEQSLYDLQKVNRQATEKVIRDGQMVYEQDADKLRQAKEAVQDAKFDLQTNELKTQIDNLQETLNGLNDTYQEQLESLQKISDKWSEINGKISQAQNESKADEILGKGWKDKILSGNDTTLFQNITQMYTGISEQILQYKEQIDATNQISTLLESYIASYKDGTLSYTQALTGINDLLSQLNQKMPAADGLQNLYDYYGAIKGTAANGDSIFSEIQKSLAATAGDLVKSLEQYNKNYGAISEYTSSWQQLTDNVASMLRVLKEVRDNLKSTEDDDDEDKKSNKKSNGEPYIGGGWVSGGPGDPGSKSARSLKIGIQGGLIGNSTLFDREAKMKLLGLKKLEPDEFPTILHKNEAVFNTEQQDTLLSNLGQAWNYTPFASSFLTDVSNGSGQTTTNFEFGDIRIESCSNTDELAQGILNGGLRNAMIQHTGKR